MKPRRATGYLMIATVFVGLFGAMAYEFGAWKAAVVWCSAILLAGWLIKAVDLTV